MYEPNTPCVYFRQTKSELWYVYYAKDLQEPTLSYWGDGKITQPCAILQGDGEEIGVGEIVYSLAEENNKMRLVQRTVTGHKQKIIEVPAVIDLSRWSEALSSLDGGWVNCLKEFPSRIQLKI